MTIFVSLAISDQFWNTDDRGPIKFSEGFPDEKVQVISVNNLILNSRIQV